MTTVSDPPGNRIIPWREEQAHWMTSSLLCQPQIRSSSGLHSLLKCWDSLYTLYIPGTQLGKELLVVLVHTELWGHFNAFKKRTKIFSGWLHPIGQVLIPQVCRKSSFKLRKWNALHLLLQFPDCTSPHMIAHEALKPYTLCFYCFFERLWDREAKVMIILSPKLIAQPLGCNLYKFIRIGTKLLLLLCLLTLSCIFVLSLNKGVLMGSLTCGMMLRRYCGFENCFHAFGRYQPPGLDAPTALYSLHCHCQQMVMITLFWFHSGWKENKPLHKQAFDPADLSCEN